LGYQEKSGGPIQCGSRHRQRDSGANHRQEICLGDEATGTGLVQRKLDDQPAVHLDGDAIPPLRQHQEGRSGTLGKNGHDRRLQRRECHRLARS
jgi:hypothetical protein